MNQGVIAPPVIHVCMEMCPLPMKDGGMWIIDVEVAGSLIRVTHRKR